MRGRIAQDRLQPADLHASLRSGRARPYASWAAWDARQADPITEEERPLMSRRARHAALVLLCLTGLLAGCGGGSASGGEDPASAVPRDAAIYLEATVRPEGALREDALAAAGKVLRTPDPAARIEQLVGEAFAGSSDPKLDYARDVEPWLGDKVGFWLAAGGSDEEAQGAAILAATDTEAAQAAIDRAVEGSDERFAERSYEGVDYQVNDDGGAAGVVEDFAVFGSEAELKRTVDALEGSSLASDDRYTAALGELDDERLAHFYFDTKALIDEALRQDPDAEQQLQQLRRVFPIDRLGPVAGAFTADGERLAIDAVTSGAGGALFSRFGALTGTGSTPLLGELPGDAWVALGSPKLGETARQLYEQLAGALGGAAIAQQLRSQLGIDLEQDVFSWVGDVAFFARGTSPDAVDGGAVIEVLDSERARSAFGKLIGVLQSRAGVSARPSSVAGAETAFELRQGAAPKPVVAARSADRVVIAYGADAAAAALSPSERLADDETFGAARELLGDGFEPGLVLSMPAVVELAAAISGGDPGFAKARPYLEAFTVLASGGKIEDDRARSRFAAGLK